MSIRFRCPNGHELNVKDKYAGKRSYCPECEGKVPIRVPELDPDDLLYRDFCDQVLGEGHSSSLSGEFPVYEPPAERTNAPGRRR